MASPGQRRGNCGHIIAAFDAHKKCARCRDKKLGDDPCVKNQLCTTGAALCNAHGQCDQIFAKVGDGCLQQ